MFNSILFPESSQNILADTPASSTGTASTANSFSSNCPACFKDLNLDQVFNPILNIESEYDLASYFYTPVQDVKTVLYRQEVQKDLDNREIFSLYDNFSRNIFKISRDMKSYAAEYKNKENNSLISKGHMLSYAQQYVTEIENLLEKADKLEIKSKGLTEFNNYLAEYVKTEKFNSFIEDTKKIRALFDEKEYSIFIKNGTIKVLKYNGEKDNCTEVENLFGKFIEEGSKDYLQKFPDRPKSEHIENKILIMLEKIYPKEFNLLDKFFASYLDFVNDTIYRFSREIRFFIGWKNFTENLKDKGLNFCYPTLAENSPVAQASNSGDTPASHSGPALFATDFFDIALAVKLKGNLVTNSFTLTPPERIMVITGPNQGGKTTFARSVGQLFYLTSLGLSVPGKEATLTVTDKILTHFEKEEKFTTQKGKLQDDIERLHNILSQATNKSLIIVNEIYASTTLKDALKLGNYMINDIA